MHRMAGLQYQRPTITYAETSARAHGQHPNERHLQQFHHRQQQQSEISNKSSSCSTGAESGNSSRPESGTISGISSYRHVGGVSSSGALIVPGSHIEIIVDSSKNIKSNNAEQSCKKVRYKNRPLFRRFINYVRNAFSGVNFSSSHDSELEELETPPRYRPDSLSALCRATRFSEAEIKRIYRGFKAECPTGVVKEDTFKVIYSQFFPQGANTGLYAHYVFNTLDQDHSGLVSFEDFVQGLSILSRGTIEEKLRWTFSLYDINGDGYITKDEMTDIVIAIYELVGRLPDAYPEDEKIKEKVDRIFQKMDVNRDGVVTLDEFLECCRNDEAISRSMAVFDTGF